MAPLQGIPILGQMEDTSVQVSHLWSPGGCHIWPRAPCLTSIMVQGITRTVAAFLPSPSVYSIQTRIMALSHTNLILVRKKILLFRSPLYGLLVGAILAKGPRPDFNNGAGDNSNCSRILAPSIYSSPILGR